MGTSSLHIKKSTAGSIVHNARENFSHSVVFTDEKNECSHTTKQAYEIYRQELAIRSEAYSARTGQKLQKNALTQLSAIFNLEKHHTLADLEALKKYLEKELDTVVYQVAIHRDEGKLVNIETGKELYSGKKFFKNPEDNQLYFDRKYTQKIDMSEYRIEKNYHAHIEFMGIDSTGAAIKRNKLNIHQLSKMQTEVAELLQMERGKIGSKKKRRDTHAFKEFGTEKQELQAEKKELKLTVKELKAEIEALRKEMANAKQFTKEDYKALYQIKSMTKKNTLSDAVDEFLIFKNRIKTELQQKEKDLQLHKTERKEIVDALAKPYHRMKDEGKNPPTAPTKFIQFVDEEMNDQRNLINELKSENRQKDIQILKLEQKINSRANMSVLEEKMREELEDIFEKEQEEPNRYDFLSLLRFLKDKYFEAKQTISNLIIENFDLKAELKELKGEKSTNNELYINSIR